MDTFKDFVQHIQGRFFDTVINNNLVYNACWEDPRIDRELLQLDGESSVVMLTSAGCNALDYLLDDPESVYAVDSNPNQNALLELKKAFFTRGGHELLFEFFGKGHYSGARVLYEQLLRPGLSAEAKYFWDRQINCFSRTTTEPSFYFTGTAGKVALMMHRHIKRKGLYRTALNLLESRTHEEQRYYFDELESGFWSGFYSWLLRQNSTLALLGVPPAQRNLIDRESDGGLLHFIKRSLRHVFTGLPLRDNYFWRVYLTGSYTPACCPNYLKKGYFHLLSQRVERIQPVTSTLSTFLQHNPGPYTHFVLLDHQDWMAHSRHGELEREWRLILGSAEPGARILFRSASSNVDFLPEFVLDKVEFIPERTGTLHEKDRVGTYGSTHLGVVIDQ